MAKDQNNAKNKHTVIYELRQMLEEVQKADNKDLPLLLTKVLAYATTEKETSSIYNKIINIYNSIQYKNDREKVLKFLCKTLDKDKDIKNFEQISFRMFIFEVFNRFNENQKKIFNERIKELGSLKLDHYFLQLLQILKGYNGITIGEYKNGYTLLSNSERFLKPFALYHLNLFIKITLSDVYNREIELPFLKVLLKYFISILIFTLYEGIQDPSDIDASEILPHLSLTSQETKIYDLITEDSTIKSIGDDIKDNSKNYGTTNKHFQNIARKLGFENGALSAIKKYKRQYN